jgi:nitroreductase family protein
MEMRTEGNSNSEHYDVLNNVLRERYSCRGFLSDCVPRATIERILVAAQRTASWCNAQPWQIAILTGAATIRTRKRLLEHVQHVRSQPDLAWPLEYHGAYQERRRECGLQLYSAVGVARGDTRAAEEFPLFRCPARRDRDHGSSAWHVRSCRLRGLRRQLRTRRAIPWCSSDCTSCTRGVSGFLAATTGFERGPSSSYAAFRSAMKTPTTLRTDFEPLGPRLHRSSRGLMTKMPP